MKIGRDFFRFAASSNDPGCRGHSHPFGRKENRLHLQFLLPHGCPHPDGQCAVAGKKTLELSFSSDDDVSRSVVNGPEKISNLGTICSRLESDRPLPDRRQDPIRE